MTKLRELYFCEICKNLVEIVQEGKPALVCCGEPMKKLEPKTEDQGNEKHVPVVEDMGGKVKVKVGDVAHPMEDKHYINFIEVLTEDRVYRAELKPGQKPEAEFPVAKGDIKEVREFCNIHMLWKA